MIYRCFLYFYVLLGFGFHVVYAQDFLEPDKAFSAHISKDSERWQVKFEIADGYYLYRDKLTVNWVSAAAGQSLVFNAPRGQLKFDSNLNKEVEILEGQVLVGLLFQGGQPQAVSVSYQGCAQAGLCYPPIEQVLSLTSSESALTNFIASTSTLIPSSTGAQGVGGSGLNPSAQLSQKLAAESLWFMLPLFFGLGVLLAFTPCVLPMLPILSALVVGQNSRRKHAVGLALVYVSGMSLIYVLLGIAAGLTGASLAASLQQPWVLGLFAVVLAVFGLGMLGAFNLQMPLGLQNNLNTRFANLRGGSYGSVFLIGAVSAILVGPCVTPPLAGALLYVSTSGDAWGGGLALFALAWGFGTPLILVAAMAGGILPKVGLWMDSVKQFFGFLLIALAIYTLAPILKTPVFMAFWAVFFMVCAAVLGAFQSISKCAGVWERLRQGLAWALLVLGILQAIGAASGDEDVFMPLAHSKFLARSITAQGKISELAQNKTSSQLPFVHVSSAEVDMVLKRLNQPAFLDFYADWCVACKEMERFTFSDAEVQAALKGIVWLQVDVTNNTPEDQGLLKRYQLFGPPGIVFFDAQGQEIMGARVVGFQDAKQFRQTVARVF